MLLGESVVGCCGTIKSMRFSLVVAILLVLVGVYFFVPYQGFVEKMRERAKRIIDNTSESLPDFEDIGDITSSVTTMFEEVDFSGMDEGEKPEVTEEEGRTGTAVIMRSAQSEEVVEMESESGVDVKSEEAEG